MRSSTGLSTLYEEQTSADKGVRPVSHVVQRAWAAAGRVHSDGFKLLCPLVAEQGAIIVNGQAPILVE